MDLRERFRGGGPVPYSNVSEESSPGREAFFRGKLGVWLPQGTALQDRGWRGRSFLGFIGDMPPLFCTLHGCWVFVLFTALLKYKKYSGLEGLKKAGKELDLTSLTDFKDICLDRVQFKPSSFNNQVLFPAIWSLSKLVAK